MASFSGVLATLLGGAMAVSGVINWGSVRRDDTEIERVNTINNAVVELCGGNGEMGLSEEAVFQECVEILSAQTSISGTRTMTGGRSNIKLFRDATDTPVPFTEDAIDGQGNFEKAMAYLKSPEIAAFSQAAQEKRRLAALVDRVAKPFNEKGIYVKTNDMHIGMGTVLFNIAQDGSSIYHRLDLNSMDDNFRYIEGTSRAYLHPTGRVALTASEMSFDDDKNVECSGDGRLYGIERIGCNFQAALHAELGLKPGINPEGEKLGAAYETLSTPLAEKIGSSAPAYNLKYGKRRLSFGG